MVQKTFQEWQYGEAGEHGSKVQLQCIGRSPCNHKIIKITNIVDAFVRQYLFIKHHFWFYFSLSPTRAMQWSYDKCTDIPKRPYHR